MHTKTNYTNTLLLHSYHTVQYGMVVVWYHHHTSPPPIICIGSGRGSDGERGPPKFDIIRQVTQNDLLV